MWVELVEFSYNQAVMWVVPNCGRFIKNLQGVGCPFVLTGVGTENFPETLVVSLQSEWQ